MQEEYAPKKAEAAPSELKKATNLIQDEISKLRELRGGLDNCITKLSSIPRQPGVVGDDSESPPPTHLNDLELIYRQIQYENNELVLLYNHLKKLVG